MKFPLHILHLEDDPVDAALVQSTLEAGGIGCATTCVQSRADFVAALEQGGIDLILSDSSLPAFDGLSAMEIVRTRWPDLPVILVSGTLGEERAIDSLKSGATDYVLKERLSRLVPEWLKTIYPDLKILFTSGYTDDAIAQHGVLEAGVEFLSKPYTPATLARKVREMLDK